MTVRTSHKTVTFTRPFVLSAIDGVQPAGTYSVETDEELLQTLSFPAYQRTATWIRLPLQPSSVGFVAAGSAQVVSIDCRELEAALARDAVSE